MVIDPRKVFYQKDFFDPMNASVGQIGSEMDWVNLHFRDRVDMLDGFYALLIGEWCASDGMYQYWQKEFGKGPEWIMEKAALVHFIADWKPWTSLLKVLRTNARIHSHNFCSCFRNGGMPRPMFAEAGKPIGCA